MKASSRTLALALVLLAAPFAAGCASSESSSSAQADADGSNLKWTLKSYHVIQSAHNGPVGYLKVYDVQQAGGAVYEMKRIYDKDFEWLGFVDQMGRAYRWEKYPPGAMPNPREPYRSRELPFDSIERNAMRMLGIDPALDEVTFPVAQAGDIR